MVNTAGVRTDLPVLDHLTYLNTASIGLVPRPVLQRAHQFEVDVAERGTTGFDEDAETAVLEHARRGAAQLFNADPDHVAITSSFTEALSQLAWSVRPGKGTNVVSTDADFPSVTYPWFRVAEETGAAVRLVPVVEDPVRLDIEAIATRMDDRTAVLCVSHVQYLTGHLLDLTKLADLAHAHGALLVVDATQSAGQVPIDVTASGVDACIAGGYKFTCSLFGAAACYLAPSILEALRVPFVGWRSTVEPYQLDARYQPLAGSARQLEFSTMSYAAAVALGAAYEYILALDPEQVLAHNLDLTDRLIEGLQARGATLLTPTDRDRRAAIVTARFPGHDGEAVAKALNDRGVIVSPRVGSTRFSVHFYNTDADVERALTELDEVLTA